MNRRAFLSTAAGLAFASSALAQAPAAPTTPDIPRVDVRDNNLFGRFYAAPGASHATAVLMLNGSGGGYPSERMARDLAGAGFPVLALAYCRDFQGQPAEMQRAMLQDVPLEYLFAGIDWLKARPEVRADRIALMGESRGAELALQVASLRPDIAGVIAFSPSGLRWGSTTGQGAAWMLNGERLSFVQNRFSPTVSSIQQFTDVLDGPAEPVAAAAIEVEQIRGSILMVSSTADELWPSVRMANDIETRLRAHRFAQRIDNIRYDNASHLLMGYGPAMTELRISPQFTLHFGGTAEGTETARNAAWARSKAFLAQL